HPDARGEVSAIADNDSVPELLAGPRLDSGGPVDREVRPLRPVLRENIGEHVGVRRLDGLLLLGLGVLIEHLAGGILDLEYGSGIELAKAVRHAFGRGATSHYAIVGERAKGISHLDELDLA